MNKQIQIHELIQAGEGYHLEFKESPCISCPKGDSINLFSLTCPEKCLEKCPEKHRKTNDGKMAKEPEQINNPDFKPIEFNRFKNASKTINMRAE